MSFDFKGVSDALAHHVEGLPEKEIAAPTGIGSGKKSILFTQAEAYFASPLDAMPLPQVRAAYERDRLARERLGLMRWEGGR